MLASEVLKFHFPVGIFLTLLILSKQLHAKALREGRRISQREGQEGGRPAEEASACVKGGGL